MTASKRIWTATIIFAMCCPILQAQVIYVDETKLVNNAYDIVEGTVINIDIRWDDDHSLINTYVTMKIDSAYKNIIKENEIVIKVIGGQLDGFITAAPHMPQYELNENVLVFLQKDDITYRTYGLSQGKFKRITHDGIMYLERIVDIDNLLILDNTVDSNGIINRYEYPLLKNTIQSNLVNIK